MFSPIIFNFIQLKGKVLVEQHYNTFFIQCIVVMNKYSKIFKAARDYTYEISLDIRD